VGRQSVLLVNEAVQKLVEAPEIGLLRLRIWDVVFGNHNIEILRSQLMNQLPLQRKRDLLHQDLVRECLEILSDMPFVSHFKRRDVLGRRDIGHHNRS
jgi:hypothetical protein